MATYIEYEIEKGKTVLVEVKDNQSSGVVKAARGSDGNIIIKASKTFSDALSNIKAQSLALHQQLKDAQADEVQVKFSLKATGEMGNFAIGTVGAEASYEVTLKWKNV